MKVILLVNTGVWVWRNLQRGYTVTLLSRSSAQDPRDDRFASSVTTKDPHTFRTVNGWDVSTEIGDVCGHRFTLVQTSDVLQNTDFRHKQKTNKQKRRLILSVSSTTFLTRYISLKHYGSSSGSTFGHEPKFLMTDRQSQSSPRRFPKN